MKKFLLIVNFICFASFFYAQLGINEFNCKRGFTDENGDDVDWIEIYNYSNNPVILSDFYLSDNPNNLDKWQFPAISLGSQELITICASGRENTKFPNHWEALVIPENNWKYWLGTSAPPNDWKLPGFNDQSWDIGQGGIGYGDNDDNTIISTVPSLFLRKEFQVLDLNDITQLLFHADYDDGFIAYLNGVEIMRSYNFNNFYPSYNELTNANHEAVLYNGGIPDHIFFNTEEIQELLVTGSNLLAIQVHNASANSSDMTSNFFLSAGIASTNINYQTLPNWIIPPLIYVHTDYKLSHGETIVISDSNETIIDSVLIPNDITNTISMGRKPDGNGNWCYFKNPSPNAENTQNTCFTGISDAPTTDLPSGWYQSTLQINITSPPNTTTYYTTNGDTPDTDDNIANGSIIINSSSVLSIKSFDNSNQMLPSSTIDRTYIINELNHELPVFSIITDDDNLWNWNTGIYVAGPNAGPNYPYFGSNFWQPWSKKSRMEFFNKSKVKQFEAHFDLEIHGGWSRAEPQKSFRIDTKSIYTGDIDYTLIENKPEITSYNNFNLRNGGQHTWSDRIQDAIISRLAINSHIDRMGYQPCIVYLNGDYWGLYGIREKIDEHYVESNHGIDSKKVDLLNRDSALSGSSSHFAETYYLIQNTSVSDTNFINVLESRFDLNNYMDYFIFQTYIQNMDWLGIAWGLNNVKLWRPDTTGGKWRYVLYDTDAAFGYFGQNIYDNYLNYARYPNVPNEHASIFHRSLLNDEFKCQFTNRYDDLINTTFQSSNFNAITTNLKSQIQSAIPDHIARWGNQVGPGSYSQWSNAINNIMQYNNGRISTARQHLNQTLSLQGEKQVNLDAYPINTGWVKVNSITPNLPWNGIYHGGCPIHVKAIPNSGYLFSHWYSNSQDYNNLTQDSIEVDLSSNVFLVANFTTCENSIDVEILAENATISSFISEEITQISYEWFLNENLISTDSIIYNPINGVYQLTIRFDSCEVKSNLLLVDYDSYSIDLFPNPATSELNVQFIVAEQQDISINIYNTIGQVVKQLNYNDFSGQYNETLDVSTLSREVYFIQLVTQNGIYTEKFVLTN